MKLESYVIGIIELNRLVFYVVGIIVLYIFFFMYLVIISNYNSSETFEEV